MGNKWAKWKSGFFLVAGGMLILSFCGCSRLTSLAADSSHNTLSQQENGMAQKDLANFVSSLRPYQESTESILKRASYFQKTGKYRLAIKELETIVKVDFGHLQAYNSMGICYDQLGEYERAAYCYKKALALDPHLAFVQNNLGYSYLLRGDLDSAISTFRQAIALDDQENLYHNNLGLAYAEKGLFEAALEQLSLSGGESKAHYNLAQICFKKGLNAEARMHLARAAKIPDQASTDKAIVPSSGVLREAILHKPQEGISDSCSLADNRQQFLSSQKTKPLAHLPANVGTDGLASMEKERGIFSVQVASCKLRASAESVERSLAELGYRALVSETSGSDKWYVVRTGPFDDLREAESAAQELAGVTIGNPSVIHERGSSVETTQLASHLEEMRSLGQLSGRKLYAENFPGIEVSNGNGVRFMARDVSKYLTDKGCKVGKLTNAETFDNEKTVIYYCDGYFSCAYLIAQELPGWSDLQKVRRLGSRDIKIRLVIGKDLALFREAFNRV